MKPREINEVLKKCPLAYIAWGAHEWHGVHNPVGLDALKAHSLALELCGKTGGVVLPPVYAGFKTMKTAAGCRHTLEFSREIVGRYLYEHLENLREEKFKAVVVIMGHYGSNHVAAIRETITKFNQQYNYPKVMAIADYEPASWVNIQGGDHGGKNETSLMMHYRPELVDLSRLPKRPLDAQDGISPNAAEASREHGAMLAKVFVEQAEPKIIEFFRQAVDSYPKEIVSGD